MAQDQSENEKIAPTVNPQDSRASTISPDDVEQLLEESLSNVRELRGTLETVFCLPPSSSSLRLK